MANTTIFEDIKINVKFKLSALWASVMCCYIYGDFFSLFVPGRIENLMKGNSGAGVTTPMSIFLFALLMTLPSLMIFFSLALKATINRYANIVMGILFTAVMVLVVASSIGKWMVFYTYLGVVEIMITCSIVVIACRWPRS